jgi:hypothetical protein
VLHPQNEAYDLCINLIIGMFLIHCNVCSIAMYSIISINIDLILAFGTGPRILLVGASAKRARSTACSGRSGRDRRCAPGPEAATCSKRSDRG